MPEALAAHAQLLAALRPLARIAEAIEADHERLGHRPDDAPIWCASTQDMPALRLTMADARAALAVFGEGA
jgi:hypothetical protein